MKWSQTRWIMALLAVVLLVMAACAPQATAPAADSGESAATASDAEAPAADEAAEAPAASGETVRQAFGGGPVGGAYQTFANAMSLLLADANPNLDIAAEGTGGSAANLRSVNSGDIDYGISYAGDLYLGRNGLLADDPVEYSDVRAVAALYGGVVHLVVRADSDIQTPQDLVGKRFAPGNAGSGAALSAERFFKHLGIWDDINVEYLGYSQAAAALGDGQLDGFWVLAAFPMHQSPKPRRSPISV
ncbi:MAG: TAXI family TRAP transporter solute-binding subunit [Caldilineaceae bacterium]